MPRSKGRTGRPWLRLRTRILAQRRPCWLCGRDIDPDLPWRDPDTGRVNPWAGVIDHIRSLSNGGDPRDPANLAAAHAWCNNSRGNRDEAPVLVTSRRW